MLWIKDLHKHYKSKKGEGFHALKGIDLSLEEKGFIFLLGKSGSGKSTLLNILGGLDTYDSGEIIIHNRQTEHFKSHEWDTFRNTYVGFVFQEFYMIDSFTIGKNISISLELQGYPKKEIKQKIEDILKQVGLEGYANRKPSEISGGQKQRIAIARALIKDPKIILADEPTGNLDSETGKAILDLLKELSKEKLVIMVTHEAEYARTYGDRIIELKDGIIINDGLSHDQSNEGIYENVDEDIVSLIHFSKGKHLNQQTIQYLNQQTKKNADSYIILTTNLNTITSSHIETKENNVTNTTFGESVRSTDQQLKLRDVKLPSKNAIKLAINSILKKKFRFILINFLFIISLVFLGFATMFSFFSLPDATSKTIFMNDVEYMGFKKEPDVIQVDEHLSVDFPKSLSEEEIEEIKKDYPSISFTTSTAKNMQYTHADRSEMGFFTDKLKYITIIDDQEMFPLFGGRYPSEVGEVLISDYIARVMQLFVYKPITMTEILGKTIVIDNQEYKIVGFVETDYYKYNHLSSSRSFEQFEEVNFFNTAETHYQHLYMTKDTYEFTFNRILSRSYLDEEVYDFKLVQAESFIIPDLIGESRLPILNNEIIIPASFAYKQLLSKSINNFTLNDEDLLSLIGSEFNLNIRTIDYSKSKLGRIGLPPSSVDLPTRSYQIVGIYNDINTPDLIINYVRTTWFGTKAEIKIINELLTPYRSDYYNPVVNIGYVKLSEDQNVNKRFINQLTDENLIHVTEFSEDLNKMNQLINRFESVLYMIGFIIASFTGLMIFLFISMSIHMKQKEIGILRAIGARGIDIAKIYLIEGFIIALTSSIWANGIIIGLVYFINYYIAFELNYKLALLTFGLFNIFLVFSIALIIVMISTFLPIKRITIMKPIDAIKKV